MHVRIFFQWIAVTIVIIVTVSFFGSVIASQVVRYSGFRLAMAANGQDAFVGKNFQVSIGNSQLMDGLSADQINMERRDVRFLNLAFNGLYSPDLVAVMETFYKSCGCTVDRLYVNVGALEDETPGTSEVQVFMSAFNKDLRPQIYPDDSSRRFSLSILPLLRFNNEVFLRSAYYWFIGHDDQGHGNAYRLRIPKVSPNRYGGAQKKAFIDFPRIERLVEITRINRTELILVVPPFHPLYVENRAGFAEYVSQVRADLHRFNLPILDHSAGIVAEYDGYADLIHLNLEGQKTYSRYFAERVIP